MPTVIAFGHVSSGTPFQYGPFEFKPNWKGTFKALEILDHAQKFAVPSENGIGGAVKDIAANYATNAPPSIPYIISLDGSERAQDVNRDRLLQSLALQAISLEHMRITAETKPSVPMIMRQITWGSLGSG